MTEFLLALSWCWLNYLSSLNKPPSKELLRQISHLLFLCWSFSKRIKQRSFSLSTLNGFFLFQEIAASFAGGGIRLYENGPAFIPGEICRSFRSAGEKLLHHV